MVTAALAEFCHNREGMALLRGVSRTLISRLGPRAATRSLVSVGRVPDAPKIGLLTLEKGPVNSLDTSMLDAIRAGVGELENAGDVKAFVLTSKFDGKVFSAGLDLLEMHDPASRADL